MDRPGLPIASLILLLCAALPASASTLITLNLSGIASNMDVTNVAFGVTGNYTHGGSGWQVQNPTSTDFTITRNADSSSPDLFKAATYGTHIKTAELDFFNSTYSTTVPYLDFQFTNGLVTAFHSFLGGGGGVPQESFSFDFTQVTIQYVNDAKNPWGSILPVSTQLVVGPFSLNFAYDLAFDAAQFGTSDVYMDPTIPGQLPAPVPEPASLLLLGSGLAGLTGVVRHRSSREQAEAPVRRAKARHYLTPKWQTNLSPACGATALVAQGVSPG